MKKILILSAALVCLLSACKEPVYSPEYYKERAIYKAQQELKEYAERESIPVEEFKGPYADPHTPLEGEPQEYTVLYYHPKHFFSYDSFTSNIWAYPYSKDRPMPQAIKDMASRNPES